ncbi:MAG: hypothetical protein ACJA0N_001672 [Pseudohongiellaceae bacterium]|jgi:hypothetical protein
MLRIAVSVEGATEREFVSQVLKPHFESRDMFLQPIDIKGNVSLDKIQHELKGLLYGFDYTTTLYDYYGFKCREGRSVGQLEKAITSLVPDNKKEFFIPYLQLHEFEALLFSSPTVMAGYFGDNNKKPDIERIVRDCGGPEAINSSYDTCPNRRISGLFPGFDKKLDGPEICKIATLPVLRWACPRFDQWVARLESII